MQVDILNVNLVIHCLTIIITYVIIISIGMACCQTDI